MGRFYLITSAMLCISDTGMIVYQVIEDFSSNESTSAKEERIREDSKIYRKDDKRPLSAYQKAINSAAGNICVRDPTMLTKKENLDFSSKRGNQGECCSVKFSVCKAYV